MSSNSDSSSSSSSSGAVLPLAGDPIIQIGTVFIQNGAEPERHIFVFHPSGECDNIPGLPKECLHRFRTEKGLIIGWAKALVALNTLTLDPEVVQNTVGILFKQREDIAALEPLLEALLQPDPVTESSN